jgi:drug/metabolite transporter (DMT)-like permease
MNALKKSYFYAFIAALLWSTVATAFKVSLRELSPYQLLFLASTVSFIAITTIAIKNEGIEFLMKVFSKEAFLKNILLGAINPFLYYFFLFKAYSILPASEALALNYVWPIVLSVMSIVFLKQKFSFFSFVGLLIAFSGALIVILKNDFTTLNLNNLNGAIYALSSSFFWSFFWILNLTDKRSVFEKLSGAFLIGALFSLAYLIFFDKINFSLFSISFFAAIYVGCFEMGITFLIWLKALSLSNQNSRVASIAYLSPFLSLVFISIILSETIKIYSIIGLTLILIGVVFQKIKSKREEK